MKYLITALALCTGIFNISAQHRMVLVEQFTNSGCPPCAGNTPVVASYVNAHSDSILMIAYHTSFPYQDSMYHENPVESNARVAYYNVLGVPRSIVDGNYFSGNLLSTLNTTLMNRAAVPPRYQIEFITSERSNNVVQLQVRFTSIDQANQGEILKAHVVLVEKNVLKSSYVCCAGANSENEYPWVMRKMLPDQNGTPISNTMVGGVDLVSNITTTTNFKDLSELRVIAFVQNETTREIYQGAISTPVLTTGINTFENQNQLFSIIQPVTDNHLQVNLRENVTQAEISISDILGNVVLIKEAISSSKVQLPLHGLPKGIYLVTVSATSQKQTRRFIIQ
jgi:hypothetical protein